MTIRTSPFPRMLAVIVLLVAPWTLHGQCFFSLVDAFDDEAPFDISSLDPNGCATLNAPLLSPNWHNVSFGDLTDWLPHEGETPTNGTGPFSTSYVLPYVPNLNNLGLDTPSNAEGWGFNPFIAVNDCTAVPLPEASPSEPYIISEETLAILQNFFTVWPGIGGLLGSPYLYVEATGCCEGTAVLESDTISMTAYDNIQLAFRHHMQGANMGSLVFETSLDGGFTWVQQWAQLGTSGAYWKQETVDLTSVLAGVEGVLMRFVATVGPGDLSDIALDDISLLAVPTPLTVFEDSVLTFPQLEENCWIQVEFDKPSDSGLPCLAESEVEQAELQLNLSLGEHFRYGETSLGEGVNLQLEINALDAAGQPIAACSAPDTVSIRIIDDRHPEQLYVHDFKACYADVDHFEVIVLGLDTAGADFPDFVNDIEFHVQVDLEERFLAHDQTVTLNSPVLPSGSLAPVQFSWNSACDFPAYRFELLRLHKVAHAGASPCGGGGDASPVRAYAARSDWVASALTLEVYEEELDLTMMEGTGFYAWRVQPIGDFHPGGEGNDLNYGSYSGFSTINPDVQGPQTIGDGCEPGVFWYEDPNDAEVASKNRSMRRTFARNTGLDKELLIQEGVTYVSEDGFESQRQTLVRSQELTLVQQGARDFSGRERLSILPVPLADGLKGNLDYESTLVEADGGFYRAEAFDGDETFREPLAMEGMVSDYYSDTNPEQGIPNAEGYPFSDTTYTRDGTNRPMVIASQGPVKRMKQGLDARVTRILYGSVGEAELVRVFGHEAPDVGSVEKVMTMDPESVTRVDYIDEQGRVIASCLAANSAMDEEKIVTLAPDEGFTSSRLLDGEQVGPFKWEVFHEFSLTEQTNVELEYNIEQPRFQALCGGFCAACDYRVVFKLVETDAMDVLLQDTLFVPGEVLLSCAYVSPVEWTESLNLGEGRYQFVQSVEYNTSAGGQRYLDDHVQTVQAEVDDLIDEVTAPLILLLDQVTGGDTEALNDFYAYCEEVSDGVSTDGEGVIWYRFDVGEDCDMIEVPVNSCPYDCNPATRDFEAFFNDAVAKEYLNYVDTATTFFIPTREDIPLVFGQVVGRDTSGGALPSGAHALFPQWQSRTEPGAIRNVAANSYGVMNGEFNRLMENLIHDGGEFPEIYPGYTCYNIHYKLEALVNQHIYTFGDTVVADLLLDELGRHFRALRLPVQNGLNGAGFLADASVPLEYQGWKSHPHKFLRAPDPEDPCIADGSMFGITAQAVDLLELTYSTEEKRDIIESTYNILYNCLEGQDGESVEQGLSSGNGEGEAGQSEFGADGVTAENILEVWGRDCQQAIAAKRAVYEELAEDFIDIDGLLIGSVWAGEDLLNRDCLVAQLVKHAEALCYLPHELTDTLGPLVESPNLVDDTFYRVIDDGSGEFIRYGAAEFGAHAANRELRCIGSLNGTGFEEVKNSVALKEYGFGILPQWSDEDVQRIAAITYGSVELCSGDCDTTTFDSLPTEVAVATAGDTIFSDTFEEVDGSLLPVAVEQDALGQWAEMHDAGGNPMVVQWGIGNDADNEVLLSSFPNSEGGFVVGNGIRTSKSITFIPGEEYEIELTVRYVQGGRMDHLFAAIAPGAWYPECVDAPYETFYPPAYTQVIGNWFPHVGYGAANHIYTLRASFIWEPMSGAPATIAPSQQLENADNEVNIGFLHLYPKQYLQSDSVVISVDDINIIHKSQVPPCDSLYVRYNILTPEPDTTRIETCEERLARQLRNRISDQAAAIRSRRAEEVREAYMADCAPQDGLTISHPLRLYHYTLQYYDAAGRLARTVPPKGVDVDDSHTRESIPDHTHVTELAYNGLGNLVRTETPDGGVVSTWYDRLERVRFTQTAQDVLDGKFRYICYDSKSRPLRTGVDMLGGELLDIHVDDIDWPEDDPSDATDCVQCEERVTTFYGVPVGAGFEQTHLVDRLSYIINQEGDTTAYSYDSQGRTAALYQHVVGLGSTLLEYDYDEATDQVREVVLNRGLADAFYILMEYDEDERVVRRFSSDDGRIWHRDVDIQFYSHGPVKREELGHYGVQGVDYTYNIHGELMAINTPSLDKADDPGGDGLMGAGDWVSEDVFGLQLGRYRGEFGRMDSPLLTQQAAHAETADLHNGEIASVTFQQRHDFGDGLGRIGHRVQYDELRRIREFQFRTFQSAWLSDGSRHSGQFGYDGNGNLVSLIRSGDDGTGTLDALTFQYVPGKNWLTHVDDAQGASVTGLDLADQQADNYHYDADGRLTADASEGITDVMWRADGKVDRVIKTDAVITFRYNPLRHRVAKIVSSGDLQDTTWYVRGQEGEILAVYHSQNDGPPTVDFRTIENGTAEPDTVPIAFASAVEPTSLFTRYVGGRRLQLKDHLGSIRAVVSDLEAAQDSDGDGQVDRVMAKVLSASDHHAFGSRLTGRHWDSIPHFFAYQGKELDDELKGPGNSYDFHARLYDPRLGRWMTRDPMEQSFAGWSPYNFVLGNPISLIDPDGKLPDPHHLPIGLGAAPEGVPIPKAVGQGVTLPSLPTKLVLKTSLLSAMTTLKYLGVDDLRTITPRAGPYFSTVLAAPKILEAFEVDGQFPGRNFQAKVMRTYFGIKAGAAASAWCLKATAPAGPWVAIPSGAGCFAVGGLLAGEVGERGVLKLYEYGDAAVGVADKAAKEFNDAGNSYFSQLEDWIRSGYRYPFEPR